MVFYRVRKIGNNHYRYRETRKREGRKVRSISEFLGKVAPENKGLRFIERQTEKYPRQHKDDPTNDQIKAAKEKPPSDESGED